MIILDLLLSVPAEIVAVNVLSLLSGHDIVRFNSATLSQHARRPLWEALDMCAPVVLQVDEKQGFEVEYAAWGGSGSTPYHLYFHRTREVSTSLRN
jgi:hypothetical protein